MIFEKIQLDDNENIIAVVRKHWFFLFKQYVVIVFFVVVPPLLLFTLNVLLPKQTLPLRDYLPHILFLYAVWLLINWMMAASIWTEYYLDVWCITNLRVIKIHQIAFFHRETGSFRLERLQDVYVEVKGIIPTLLDYGTIHLETASEDVAEFRSDYIPKPQDLKAIILKAADSQMQRNNL